MQMNEFSVCLFFPDGSSYYERRGIGAEEAVSLLKECSERSASMIGMIQRIIVTDGGDYTNLEWQYGKGITYPPRGADGRFIHDGIKDGR
jgi:hypothetical protein